MVDGWSRPLWLTFALTAGPLFAQAGPTDAVAPGTGTIPVAPERPVLDRILDAVDREAHLEVGVRVETLAGELLYDFQGTESKRLASNNKLITTAAALLALGPEYRWHTEVLVEGNTLRIVGDGDPSLRRIGDVDHGALFLDAVAQVLNERGLTADLEVELDDRAFGPQSRHPGWPKDQWQATYCAPVTALSVAGGCIEIESRGGRVRSLPAVTSGMRLRTASRKGKSLSAWWGANPGEIVVAPGSSGRDATVRLAVQDPQRMFRAWLRTGLEARGIAITGIRHMERDEPTAEGEMVLMWPSAWNLAEVLVVTNKKSDNYLAEVLLKTLGHELGEGGDYAHSLAVVPEVLREELALDLEFRQDDGSGMARSSREDFNTASPATLCALLRAMAERPEGALYFDTLPIAGVEERLAKRFREAIFQPQRIHAKTGFIRGASSLSGYLMLPDSSIAVFSFVVNFDPSRNKNTNNRRFKSLQEEFLEALLREES